MKRLTGIVLVSAMVLGMTTSALADELCEKYDVVGTVDMTNGYAFLPNGSVTYGEANWWDDDVMACYKTYYNPAYMAYFSACDFDGSGLVEASEVLDIYYYVQDYPSITTPGYYSHTCNGTCEDLTNVDFGGPLYIVGYGIIHGQCTWINGGYVPDGVGVFNSMEECQEACSPPPICQDVSDVDFGGPLYIVGYGIVNGQCTWINGGYVPEGVYLFNNLEDCRETCHPEPICHDVSDVDFGGPLYIVGYGNINGECTWINGGYVPEGITLFNSAEECASYCGCHDVSDVDFGGPLYIVGYGIVNGECTWINGGYVPDGIILFDSVEECQATCSLP